MPAESDFDKFRAEADLTEHVTQLWMDQVDRSFTLNGEKYRFAWLEEVPDAEPNELIIRRESDGRMFDAELWVNLYSRDPEPADVRPQETVEVAEKLL